MDKFEQYGKLIIIGFATLCWFKGMYRIMEYILPDTLSFHILLSLIGITIFFLDDARLNSLSNTCTQQYVHKDHFSNYCDFCENSDKSLKKN